MNYSDKLFLTSNPIAVYDLSYRYQINLPQFKKIIKKGTIITLFTNSIEFAKSINIDETSLVKSISYKLSCQTNMDSSLKCSYFVGDYDNNILINIINNFIKTFILCKKCDLPELLLSKNKNKICQKCKACGNINIIDSINIDSKTYNFVLNKLKNN